MKPFNKRLINVGLSVILGMLFACKSKYKSFSGKDIPKDSLTIQQLNVDSIKTPFQTLAFSGKVEIEEESNKSSYQYKLHFYKDSLIWCSLSWLGIEGVRLKMTADSIWLVDRLNKQYLKGSLDLLPPKIGITLTVRQLQQLFLGELPVFQSPFQITQQAEQTLMVNCQSAGQSITCLLSKPNLRLKSLNADDKRDSSRTQIEFAAYQHVQNVLIPNLLRTQSNKGGNREVTLKHHQVLINPATISFSFSIPSGYEPME